MLYGYTGKILDVDLTLERIKIRAFRESFYKNFIGGSGLGVAILVKELSPYTSPLGIDNILVLAVGPITGTLSAASARFALVTRSPLTNILGESTAGGRFGVFMKRSGFDAIIIRGRSPKPVYLYVYNGNVEIRDASHLWGLDTFKTTDILKEDIGKGDIEVAAIGPAGENLVKFSAVVCEKGRIIGRSGAGAVFGSKNLKAIVVGGNTKFPIYDMERLVKKYKEVASRINQGEVKLRVYGTQASIPSLLDFNDTPIKNWSMGLWEEGKKKFEWDYVNSVYKLRRKACPSCPIGCEGVMEDEVEGKVKAPEYETMASFGPLVLNDDLKAISKYNILLNKLGLDSISTGSVIAFAMEAYEKGFWDEEKLGKVEWGDTKVIEDLIKEIAYKSSLRGILLSEGSYRASKILGIEDLAVTVKGLEVAMHDPRAAFSSALMYATQPRGGSHTDLTYLNELRGLLYPEISVDKQLDRFSIDKAELVIKIQNLSALADSLVFCKFGFLGGVTVADLIEFINSVTGWNVDYSWIHETGARLFNLKRIFDVRLGINRSDDTLPKKLLTPLKEGSAAGRVPDLDTMLKDYYRLRGWNEQGIPIKDKVDDYLIGYLPKDYLDILP